jgi:hypothetical protein
VENPSKWSCVRNPPRQAAMYSGKEENVEQVLPRISSFSCFSSAFMNDIFDNEKPQYLKNKKWLQLQL